MGVLDDILESPPEELTSRQVACGILWVGFKWIAISTAVLFGIPLLLLILITIFY